MAIPTISLKLTKQFTVLLTAVLLSTLILPVSANDIFGSYLGWAFFFGEWIWLIPLIIAIEAVAIRLIFKLSWKSAFLASVGVNIVTAILGIFIHPIALHWLHFPPEALSKEVVVIVFAIATINAAIELSLLALIFKAARSWSKAFKYLLVNLLTASLMLSPAFVLSSRPDLYLKARLYLFDDPTTIFVWASESGFVDVMALALTKGADKNEEATRAGTLLISMLHARGTSLRAIAIGSRGIRLKAYRQLEAIKWLIENGADVNSIEAEAALLIAKENKDFEVYKLLKEAGVKE